MITWQLKRWYGTKRQTKKLGLNLPKVSTPGGNYVSVNVREDIAYIAIQFPIHNDDYKYQGCLGNDLSSEDGIEAISLCALYVLAHVDQEIGFDNIIGLNHFDAYFQSGTDWDDSPWVVNGASELFVNVLGEKGLHSRAIIGVDKPPETFALA